jgi:4-hydroxybenzoate polyprenyltransferase
MSKLLVYLRLGRVSNLPTVWTNTLAGVLLGAGRHVPGAAGAWSRPDVGAPKIAGLAAIMSLFYVAGMFLNDAFDRGIDAKERPERPIPSGQVTAAEVFSIGFGLLGLGVGLLYWTSGFLAAFAGFALAGNIVLYDVWHKTNPLSPVVMGGCRVLVYVTTALASGGMSLAVLTGAGALLAYLVGLTYTAKIESKLGATLWPLVFLAVPFVKEAHAVGAGVVPALAWLGFLAIVVWAVRLVLAKRAIGRAIVLLLAGVSLLDALLLASAGHAAAALVAALGFFATRGLQRWIAGT